eukprot:UN32848
MLYFNYYPLSDTSRIDIFERMPVYIAQSIEEQLELIAAPLRDIVYDAEQWQLAYWTEMGINLGDHLGGNTVYIDPNDSEDTNTGGNSDETISLDLTTIIIISGSCLCCCICFALCVFYMLLRQPKQINPKDDHGHSSDDGGGERKRRHHRSNGSRSRRDRDHRDRESRDREGRDRDREGRDRDRERER